MLRVQKRYRLIFISLNCVYPSRLKQLMTAHPLSSIVFLRTPTSRTHRTTSHHITPHANSNRTTHANQLKPTQTNQPTPTLTSHANPTQPNSTQPNPNQTSPTQPKPNQTGPTLPHILLRDEAEAQVVVEHARHRFGAAQDIAGAREAVNVP